MSLFSRRQAEPVRCDCPIKRSDLSLSVKKDNDSVKHTGSVLYVYTAPYRAFTSPGQLSTRQVVVEGGGRRLVTPGWGFMVTFRKTYNADKKK